MPKPAPDVEVQQEEPQKEQQIDAVIVIRTKQPDGSITTEVMVQGAVELDQVQTLLELAVRGWRKRIGLVD